MEEQKSGNSTNGEVSESLELKDEEVVKALEVSTEPLDLESIKVGGELAPTIPATVPKSPEEIKAPPVLDVLDDETKQLYLEFNTFLEKKVQLTEDTGIKKVIPTGIDLLDAILGGGFAIGTLNMIVGQPGCGKSMLASQVLGNAQKLYKGRLLSGYLDSEEAMTTIRLANLGVRYPMIKPYTDLTVEKIFRYIEGLCLFKIQKSIVDIPSVVVWDSLANTLSNKEKEAQDPNSVIGYRARLLSLLVPQYISKLNSYSICLIVVNQLRDVLQMGMYAPAKDLKFLPQSKDIAGGNTIKFNSFALVELKIKSVVNPDKLSFEGIIVKAKCVKNKLFPPNVEVELVGDFVRGFSNFWTNYNFLVSLKAISTGPWNSLVTLPAKKFRTKDAETLYGEDQEFKQYFDAAVKTGIQTDIVEKYNPVIS